MVVLCTAKAGSPEGWLTLKTGEPIPDESLAAKCRCSVEAWQMLRDELISRQVIVRGELHDALYIPRLVRDAAIRTAAKAGGKRGGNPALFPDLGNLDKPAPATLGNVLHHLADHLKASKEVHAAFAEYWEKLQVMHVVWTLKDAKEQCYLLKRLSPAEAVRWITHARQRPWKRIYPPPKWWSDQTVKVHQEEGRVVLWKEAVNRVFNEMVSSAEPLRILRAARDKYRDMGKVNHRTVEEAADEMFYNARLRSGRTT
jgi:hypothetical protein